MDPGEVKSEMEGLTYSDYAMLWADEHVPPPESTHVTGVPRLAALMCGMDPERVLCFMWDRGAWRVDLDEATDGERDRYMQAFHRAARVLGYDGSCFCFKDLNLCSVSREAP